MQEGIIFDFIKKNKKEMKKNDLVSFLNSDNFNDLGNCEVKRILFYIQSFLNSTKRYKSTMLLINELSSMIESIKNNKDYQNIHESYQFTICNYFEQIIFLIENTDAICDKEFINDLNIFVETIAKMYYIHSNELVYIIKYLKNIQLLFQNNKNNIKEEIINKYERCLKILNNYIEKMETKMKESNSFNNYNNGQQIIENKQSIKNSFTIFNNNSIINETSNNPQNSNNWNSLYPENIYSETNDFQIAKYSDASEDCKREKDKTKNNFNDFIDNSITPNSNYYLCNTEVNQHENKNKFIQERNLARNYKRNNDKYNYRDNEKIQNFNHLNYNNNVNFNRNY